VGKVANHFLDGTSFKNQGLKLYPVSPGSQPFCIFPDMYKRMPFEDAEIADEGEAENDEKNKEIILKY
jgi:hypothetical protein